MRNKLETKFDFKYINELREQFEKKKWDDFDEFNYFFNNFCSLSEHLNDEQSQLVMELTEDFLWLREKEYYNRFRNVLRELAKSQHLNFDKVFIVPMLSPDDRKDSKTKSSKVVAYLSRNTMFKFTPEFKSTNFIIIDELKHLPEPKYLEDNNFPLVVVDDFVGTGDTATDALKEILGIKKYSNKYLYVLSLVAQKRGIKAVKDMGFKLLTDTIAPMGITDKYNGQEQNEKKQIMQSIEDVLAQDKKFKNKYRFGYKTSEALVTMIRTPNNTFPMYWWNAKLNKGKKWNAPFPR